MKTTKAALALAVTITLVLGITDCNSSSDSPTAAAVTALDLTALVSLPQRGGTPNTTITTAQYAGTIVWADGVDAHTGSFAPGTAYTATATLTVVTGYTFGGVAANSFTYTGATVTNTTGDDSVTVTIAFPSTAGVTSVAISGTPVKTIYGIGEAFDLTGLTLTASYSDSTESTEPLAASLLDTAWNTAMGTDKSITVTYGGKTATIDGIDVYNIIATRSTGSASLHGYNDLPAAFGGEAGKTAVITLYVDENVTAGGITLSAGATDITLTGFGGMRTITGFSGAAALFTITSGTILTLGTAVGDDTITIKGHTNTGEGGAVSVTGGTFTMSGGTISDNEASNGGGVSVTGGTFTMDGGTISGNTASGDTSGGGVYVHADSGTGSSTFTMKDGTISGNKASSGGGVYVYGQTGSNSTFTMKDGTISGNEATSDGGGVFVMGNGSTFTKAGGTIYGSNEPSADKNTAAGGTGKGHAVYVNGLLPKYRDTTAGPTVDMNANQGTDDDPMWAH